MDSEEPRPGSSASSSSSNSSNNSRQSSPEPENKHNNGPQSPPAPLQLCSDRKSRSRSRSSNENFTQRRSESKSNSVSSGSASSSDNENEDASSQPKSKRSSARSSSEDGSAKNEERQIVRPQSPSPVDSHRSLRHSSSSSHRSFSNSRTEPDAVAELAEAEVNITHEDLSDVSDMESEKRTSSNNNSKHFSDDGGVEVEQGKHGMQTELEINDLNEQQDDSNIITDLRQKLNKKKEIKTCENGKETSVSIGGYSSPENSNSNSASQQIEDLVKTHDEDALDFEAEEGECLDVSKEDDKNSAEKNINAEQLEKGKKSDGLPEDCEELEEGEVSDEEEKRPEETEPKPVCRFYTRGQCTWGMSCRFLHPGVTDKGNYTMFDLVRPVPVSHSASTVSRSTGFNADYHDFRTERPPLHHRPTPSHFASSSIYPPHHDPRAIIPEPPVVVESAWERGLRTAKEMMRKASKRKEQDMDFEDKKMNLPISPEELEKDAYYLKERASPPETLPPYSRHGGFHEVHSGLYTAPERFGRGPPMPAYDDIDPYGRSARYRELPPHRMPQYEDERRVRPTREVIVQRVEQPGRADEWNDPWMRSKSPGGRGGSHDRVDRRRRDHRSYSSNSSYSSSTSSQSESSSESSHSPSPADRRRRYNNSSQKSPPPARRHGVHSAHSPSSPIRRGRRSPEPRRSPLMVKRRGGYSTPSPTLDKRLSYSPTRKHKRFSPTPKKAHDRSKIKRRHSSSSSGSDSSDSSASDSDSDSGSSSSDSSTRSRGKTSRHAVRNVPGNASVDKKIPRKVEPSKKRSPISIEIKKPSVVGASALTSPTLSASSEKETKKSRREELLKQLRAVEDAIAKKRQKLA